MRLTVDIVPWTAMRPSDWPSLVASADMQVSDVNRHLGFGKLAVITGTQQSGKLAWPHAASRVA